MNDTKTPTQPTKMQQKYKHDKQLQSQKLMELYKEKKANPFTSCLPILAQSPFFFALFMVLRGIADDLPRGMMTPEKVEEANSATIFGAQLFDTFSQAQNTSAKVVAGILILLMTVSTFYQQRQLIMKNMPESALSGSFAQQQKIMMYVMPLIFGFSGFVFPIGVLIYWMTTNMWSLGQQMVVIRRMPAPGSKAEKIFLERQAAKSQKSDEGFSDSFVSPDPPKPQKNADNNKQHEQLNSEPSPSEKRKKEVKKKKSPQRHQPKKKPRKRSR